MKRLINFSDYCKKNMIIAQKKDRVLTKLKKTAVTQNPKNVGIIRNSQSPANDSKSVLYAQLVQ